jgi:hypothetical protein
MGLSYSENEYSGLATKPKCATTKYRREISILHYSASLLRITVTVYYILLVRAIRNKTIALHYIFFFESVRRDAFLNQLAKADERRWEL